MSTREELEEDARRERWEEANARRFCPTCRCVGHHHSGCPDQVDEEPEETEETDDTEEEEAA